MNKIELLTKEIQKILGLQIEEASVFASMIFTYSLMGEKIQLFAMRVYTRGIKEINNLIANGIVPEWFAEEEVLNKSVKN